MIEIEKAIEILCEQVAMQTQTVTKPLLDARGLVIAKDVVAPIAVPGFAKSGMDGYAIHSCDSKGATKETPVRLQVIGEICAGDAQIYPAHKGTAVRIMTGGAIPAGYDCVIKQEDTQRGAPILAIHKEMRSGENYCEIGEDIQAGQAVIKAHTRLTSHHIGVLASLGFHEVEVLRPLQVGVISTGNELVKPGDLLGPMQIYNSNSYAIAAHIQAAGFVVSFIEICSDEVDVFCEMVTEKMKEVDLLLTTGAVSVGKKDIIPDAIAKLGATLLFQKINMKPGTPMIASCYQNKLLLSVSGNPFAALVNFHLFFWPVAAKFMGNASFHWRCRKAKLCEGNAKENELRRFLRAYADEEGVHLYTRKHFSSVFANLADSNCIIDQPARQSLTEGDIVTIIDWKE